MSYCLIKNLLFEFDRKDITTINLFYGSFSKEVHSENRTMNIRYSTIDELTEKMGGDVRIVKTDFIPEPLPTGSFFIRNDDIKINGFHFYVTRDMNINQYFIDEEIDKAGIEVTGNTVLIKINSLNMELEDYLSMVNKEENIFIEKISDDYVLNNISNLIIEQKKKVEVDDTKNSYKWNANPFIVDQDDIITSFVKELGKYGIPVQAHKDVKELNDDVKELILYEVTQLYTKEIFGRVHYNPIWGWLTLLSIPITISYYTNSKQKYKERSNDFHMHLFLTDIQGFQTIDKHFPNAVDWKSFLSPVAIPNQADKKQVENHSLYSFQTELTILGHIIKAPPKVPRVLKKILKTYLTNYDNSVKLDEQVREFEQKQNYLPEGENGWEDIGKDNSLKD